MHTDKHLFGTDDVPEFPNEIIMRRLELLGDNLSDLLDHSTYTRTEEEASRIADVIDAIKWHENINNMGASI